MIAKHFFLLVLVLGHKDNFDWDEYLKETNSRAAPESAFNLEVKHMFQKGMKLEAMYPGQSELVTKSTFPFVIMFFFFALGLTSHFS